MTTPAVLIVEDDANLREALFDTLNSDDMPVLTADDGTAALDILERERVGLVVTDWQMKPMDGITLLGRIRKDYPNLPAILMTAHGTIENAVDVMRNGAADYLVKPFAAEELKSIVGRYIGEESSDGDVIAADPATQNLLDVAQRVARTEVTVTISGPSGCGKEVFARYIHSQSSRRNRPFIAINCAAIPESMLEAVLFGYEKGAFTGATGSFAGKFEQANGGTLLLDEISEMDLGLQAKLLRVLQEKEVERIGGREVIPLDVRVLATTNRDLRQYVAEGKFREDLYYRLNVFPLQIPALSARPGDILPLAERVVRQYGATAVTLGDCARAALRAHDWPGNVRELENVMQRTLILLSGNELRATDLIFEDTASTTDVSEAGLSEGLRDREFQLILDALKTHAGKRSDVAKALGISPRSLRYKLARMREAGIGIPGEHA